MNELCAIYNQIKGKIERRLAVFENIRNNGTEEEIFTELVFCLMTPQTKARQSEKAIDVLSAKNYIFSGTPAQLSKVLNIVRFRNTKAKNIVLARKKCQIGGQYALKKILDGFPSVNDKRKWLAENIMGMGYKEASHFLRNIGYGADLAILDRHVLRNLKAHGYIDDDGINLTPKKYLEIESVLGRFAKKLKIPLDYLDFVLWYRETNDIFK